MARERHERERDADRERGKGEGKRGQARKSPAGMFGLAIVLVVVGAAVGIFLMTNKDKQAAVAPATTEKANPFADVPPEAPPEKQAQTKGQK